MIIKQLSVIIEDRSGASWQVFQNLADNGINILSYSINDEPDHGILRLIVDNTTKADEVLRRTGFRTVLTRVYSLNVPNETGSMSHVLKRLADNGISLDFLYVFQYHDISQAILHSEDMERLESVLNAYELERLS